MEFTFLAVIDGGIGENVWDREFTIKGEDLTIAEALAKIEEDLCADEVVISIEQVD